ncbi:hypothetical protein M2158_004529 [Streptomyces sp. SAI-144]|nr:hypothetical protein [Streptomyces sp. SAI-144]
MDTTGLVQGVSGGWLYALGDVNHRALLTHQGKYQARTAGDAIAARATGRPVDDTAWGDHATTADQQAVPQVLFTDPEAAAVGLTAEQAAAAGHRVRTVDLDFNAAQGANLYADGYRGHARIVVDLDREVLLGATFAGPGVGELLHAATIAVVGEVPLKRLRQVLAKPRPISLNDPQRTSSCEPAAGHRGMITAESVGSAATDEVGGSGVPLLNWPKCPGGSTSANPSQSAATQNSSVLDGLGCRRSTSRERRLGQQRPRFTARRSAPACGPAPGSRRR